MTTKRFTINGKEIIQDKQVWCMAHSEHCADVIATAMNELHEENEKLHDEIFRLRTELAFNRTEKEEHSDSVYDFIKKLEKW